VFAIDHIAVAARTLEDGAAYVEDALGVSLTPGGKHPEMGTHNRLLRLGEDLFLEVITIDPDAPPPARCRWLGLDSFGNGAPCIQTWIARTVDLDAGLAAGPRSAGKPCHVSRGDMHWRIAVPDDGSMAYGGAYPTLIQWPTGAHPASGMAEAGCALVALEIEHPGMFLAKPSAIVADAGQIKLRHHIQNAGAAKTHRRHIADDFQGQFITLDAHQFYGALGGPHASGNIAALEGRAGWAGDRRDIASLDQTNFCVGSDVHDDHRLFHIDL